MLSGCPRFSVIIATSGREDLAVRAARSVVDDGSAPYEVLVVDQARDDRLQRRLADALGQRCDIRYLRAVPRGLSHARNAGAAHARGDVLIFLDDDAAALPGWLAGYAAAFDAGAVMVGGRIVADWESPLPRWYPTSRLFLLGLYDAGDRMIPFPAGHLPGGANFAVSKALLTRLDGFSEALGFRTGSPWAFAGEDSLIGSRARALGALILYQPQACAAHRIRREKLTFRHLLRRHFVEGRTQIEVAARTCPRTAWWLTLAVARYLVDVPRTAIAIVSPAGSESWRRRGAALMAAVSLSAGAIGQCGLRLVTSHKERI